MGLDKNFPRHPHSIISPDVRWFPGSDSIGEKGREKLLPPLVNIVLISTLFFLSSLIRSKDLYADIPPPTIKRIFLFFNFIY